MTWDDADGLGGLAILLLVIIAIWKETADFSRTEEEETMEPEHAVENDILFQGKQRCLELAIEIRTGTAHPDDIVAVAQKFWDFLRAEDQDPEED